MQLSSIFAWKIMLFVLVGFIQVFYNFLCNLLKLDKLQQQSHQLQVVN